MATSDRADAVVTTGTTETDLVAPAVDAHPRVVPLEASDPETVSLDGVPAAIEETLTQPAAGDD
jgi:hypothetical protein